MGLTMCNIPLFFLALIGIMAALAWYIFNKNKKPQQPLHAPAVTITVEAGFHPKTITIEKGKTTRFNLIRMDPSASFEEIVIPDFKIRRHLPLNHKVGFEITPHHAGEFTFSSATGDHQGKIIVK